MKFRKKPVVIEAMQFTDTDSVVEILAWADGSVSFGTGGGSPDHLLIETLEGDMTASVGDWIIKGIAGEFYPCKPDVFAATYEAVTP